VCGTPTSWAAPAAASCHHYATRAAISPQMTTIPRVAAGVGEPRQQQRREMSGFLSQKWSEFRAGSQDKEFAEMLENLAGFEVFDLNSFQSTLEDATKMAGVKGLKTKMPWVQGDPMAKELTLSIEIIKAMTPEERAKPNKITTKQKKRIAISATAEISDVNMVLSRFDNSHMMWTWVRKLQAAGKPFPKDSAEAQAMMFNSQQGRQRAMNQQMKAMKKKHKKTGKMPF